MIRILEEKSIPNLAKLYLAEFGHDPNRMIEFVDAVRPGIPREKKWVMIISTQIGCPVRCLFCDAGLKFQGNLTAEEMLKQVMIIFRDHPEMDPYSVEKIKVHFARMGEPSFNPNVLEALKLLRLRYDYPGLIACISTIAPKFGAAQAFLRELITVKENYYAHGKFQLHFSVHSTDTEYRKKLIPVPVWSLQEMAAYGEKFFTPGDRKITLNFALTLDTPFDPKIIRDIFPAEKFYMKLTPVNPTMKAIQNQCVSDISALKTRIFGLLAELHQYGFDAIYSPSEDEEIAANLSCGQLWSETLRQRNHESQVAISR